MNFTTDIFEIYDKQWALLTSGTMEKFNTMTISWGGLGTIWGMPVATVYVRTSRYTHDFMDDNEYFTVSFYPEDMKKTLGILGSKSGREIDKMHMPELTAIEAGKSVSFHEAEVTLVCRKVFKQTLEPKNMEAKIAEQFYGKDAPHDMYIGEVVDIIRR
ncbi:MAG: flavin reductase [Clostridiales bacterium]|nr:flavin reductase [Clostridiales bacterium]